MRVYLRVGSHSDLREIGLWSEERLKRWFTELPEEDQEAAFRTMSSEPHRGLFRVSRCALDVVDKQSRELSEFLNIYDQVRIFGYMLDKAMTRLPWGQIGQFTLNVANLSSDFSLGTRATFRDYVGKPSDVRFCRSHARIFHGSQSRRGQDTFWTKNFGTP